MTLCTQLTGIWHLTLNERFYKSDVLSQMVSFNKQAWQSVSYLGWYV